MNTKQDLLEKYKKAIRLKFEEEKTKDYSSFLTSPSRAKLRQLCIERFKDNSNSDDLKSFSLFFGFDFSLNIQNRLQSQTDKFRPIETFLKGKTDLTDIEGINIAAILVDFNPRPFRIFTNDKNYNKNVDIILTESTSSKNVSSEKSIVKENELNISIKNDNSTKSFIKNILKKKTTIGLISLIGLFSIGYTTKNIISPNPQCMQWQKNHYEIVDCSSENQQGLIKQNDIIPYNENQSKLIKIEVSDTTTFFKNGKSLYWYCKVNGKPEFFNTHGIHPETGIGLKRVSKYIINKYVK